MIGSPTMKFQVAVFLLLTAFAGASAADGLDATAPKTVAPKVADAKAVDPKVAEAKAAEAVKKVQAFYDKTKSFRSPFKQEYVIKAYNKSKTSSGTVVFLKPGKMRWNYTDPKNNLLVSDGQTLRVYEAAEHQMYETAVSKSQYPAALSFLTGDGKLEDSFSFEWRDGAGEMKFPGGYVLVGTPKAPSTAVQKLFLYVDAATSQVRRVLILDSQGNRNRFDFTSPRVNEPVAASEFIFTPPPGTTVTHP